MNCRADLRYVINTRNYVRLKKNLSLKYQVANIYGLEN